MSLQMEIVTGITMIFSAVVVALVVEHVKRK